MRAAAAGAGLRLVKLEHPGRRRGRAQVQRMDRERASLRFHDCTHLMYAHTVRAARTVVWHAMSVGTHLLLLLLLLLLLYSSLQPRPSAHRSSTPFHPQHDGARSRHPTGTLGQRISTHLNVHPSSATTTACQSLRSSLTEPR